MTAAITVESFDSGKALVDEKNALATYKRSAGKRALTRGLPPSWSAP